MNFLDKMTKSNSIKEYRNLYEKFSSDCPPSVVNYFNKNLNNNYQEWTRLSMSDCNFIIYTNNPSESIHAQYKAEIKPRSSLKDFIIGFFRFLTRRYCKLFKIILNAFGFLSEIFFFFLSIDSIVF